MCLFLQLRYIILAIFFAYITYFSSSAILITYYISIHIHINLLYISDYSDRCSKHFIYNTFYISQSHIPHLIYISYNISYIHIIIHFIYITYNISQSHTTYFPAFKHTSFLNYQILNRHGDIFNVYFV